MKILSSFNTDYLKEPLQFLVDQFIDTESIEINYGNIITSLLGLKKSEENKIVTVFFRLIDLVNFTGEEIDLLQLQENLQLIIDAIDILKNKVATHLVVVLCPSLEYNLSDLQFLEQSFYEKMHRKAIEVIKVDDIQGYYSLPSIENKIGQQDHIPYTPRFYITLSCFLARKLHYLLNKPYKVIVVDCDDTLWGGAVGDIGIENINFEEHHHLLQAFLVEKNTAGMLICLCSKNDEKNVIDVFQKRRNDMCLTFERVSKFKINWQLKSESISRLAQELNLGLDSFIFIDDSSFELEEVRRNLPEVLCIQAPKNKEEFFSLKDNWAFDYTFITDEDKNRTKLYREDEDRQNYQSTFNNYIQFLQSINLSILIDKLDENQEEVIKRISILSGKTNQFNLFPLSKDIAAIRNDLKNNNIIFNVRASDHFGDYGLIAVAFCHVKTNSLLVDSFFVSCRAFKKGIEYHLMKKIAQYAIDLSLDRVNLCFKRTEKNTAAQLFITLLSQKFSDTYEDIYQLDIGREITLSFSAAQLSLLDIDTLLEMQNNTQARSIIPDFDVKKKRLSEDVLNKKDYLLKLQRVTQSYNFLLDKFFFNEERLLNLPTTESKIITVCNFLLGDIQKDIALVYLGLDSLKATELNYYLYQISGIEMTIPVLLSKTTTLQGLINHFERQEYKKNDEPGNFISFNVNQGVNASFQQKRIWLAEKKEMSHNNTSSNYMMVACFSINELNVPSFKAACWQLIKRHDAFGCHFFIRDKELVQTILPIEDRQLIFDEHHIQDDSSAKYLISKEAKKIFLMHEMPLIRFSVFFVEESHKFYILFRVHHGIFDAISLQNTLSELSDLYRKGTTNIDLIDLTAASQYINFIYYQNLFYNTEDYQKEAMGYWSKVLSPLKLTTEFPYDKVTNLFKPTTEHPCRRYSFSIPQKDFFMLKQLGQSASTTTFNIMTSLFSILVSSYTYEDKVGIITATNGRNSPMFQKVIGFFVNLMVLPFDLEKNITFLDYVKENYQIFLDSFAFQELLFEKFQEIVQKQGITNILVNPALIYQSYKPAELILDGEQAILEIPEKPILYDLRETCRFGAFSLFVQEESKSMNCLIEYSASLYSEKFIEHIANNLLYLIHNVCSNPYQKLHDISCVSEKEQDELLNFSKGPLCHYDEDLISIFQQQVFNYPNFIAISDNEMTLTYRELDNLSTNLANNLAKQGIKIGEPVGLYFDKSYLFFIAELTLLKLGAVFIPLSKSDPEERLNFIIDNAKINYIISDTNFSYNFESKISLIKINKQLLETIKVLEEEAFLLKQVSLESRACILYTSGSTGTPKGVVLKQKGIVRAVKSANYIQVDNQDKVLQASNLAFDAAQLECWLAWTNAASLVFIDKKELLDYKLFSEKLLIEKITVLWLTSALFHQYAYVKPAIFSNLKYLLVGGDIVEKKALQEVFYCEDNKSINLIIGYGPTEASIFTTTCRVTFDTLNDFPSIPIGKPINNTEIRLFDRFKKLAPLGAKAHLAIGGDGLAEGYLGEPELQKERFMDYPELSLPRLYLSGDQVRLSRIDNLQLLFGGRMDGEQLKRAGFLVSLSEIEAALACHPAVRQVAVISKELRSGKKQLIAFYIKNREKPVLNKQSFSNYLSSKLPSFMLPDFYQELDQFPTTPNGKLDRKALLLYKLNLSKGNYSEALTDSQKKIVNLFSDILSFSSDTEYGIGLDDDFFNCGGSSILAVQLIYEIEQLFGVRLSFDLLRQNSSVRSIDKILKLQTVYSKLEQDSSFVVLKNGDETLAPIGFIHPAGGALYCYEDLMNKTSLNNTFFGIEDPVLSHGLQQNLSLKEIAESYLLQIERKIKRPFILSGYSFGGMLALEIAAQLEEKRDNNLIGVILIDTWIVSSASEPIKYQLKQEVLNYYSEVSRKIGESRKHLMDQLEQRYQYLQDLGFAFKPRKLENTRVTLLKATTLGSSFENMATESKNNYLLNFVNDELFDCAYIPGNHYTILEEEYVNNTSKAFYEQVMKLQSTTCDTINFGKNIQSCFFQLGDNSSNSAYKYVPIHSNNL